MLWAWYPNNVVNCVNVYSINCSSSRAGIKLGDLAFGKSSKIDYLLEASTNKKWLFWFKRHDATSFLSSISRAGYHLPHLRRSESSVFVVAEVQMKDDWIRLTHKYKYTIERGGSREMFNSPNVCARIPQQEEAVVDDAFCAVLLRVSKWPFSQLARPTRLRGPCLPKLRC